MTTNVMKNSTYLEWAHKREYEGHAKTKCDVCKENHSRFTNISTTKFYNELRLVKADMSNLFIDVCPPCLNRINYIHS